MNKTLETTSQSCLYKNLYYFHNALIILTVKEINYSVQTDAFNFWPITPEKHESPTYFDLEKFFRPSYGCTSHPIGRFALYPAYVALVRFPPRHLHPSRILAEIDHCNDCFSGLGVFKQRVLNQMPCGRWFMFDKLIMSSDSFCQHCDQQNLQLSVIVELDASRLFRDRMYQ